MELYRAVLTVNTLWGPGSAGLREPEMYIIIIIITSEPQAGA